MNATFRSFRLTAVFLMLAALVLSACAPAQATQSPPNVDEIVIYTFAALTNEAKTTQQAPPPLLPSATLAPADTQALPTVVVPTVGGCTDSAELVSEEPQDNAVFKPGEKVTKRWTLKNAGTCVWNGYRFEFDGQAMGGNATTYVNQIAPGQTIDLYAYPTAPGATGTYEGGATLYNGSNGVVPILYQGLPYQGVSIKIVVKGPGVTGVTASYVVEQGSSPACSANATYRVTVNVTVSGPNIVDYRIDLTDGSGQVTNGVFFTNGSPEVKDSLVFLDTGSQQIFLRVVGPYVYPKDLVVQVYINGSFYTSASVVCP